MNGRYADLLETARFAKEHGNLTDPVKLLFLGGGLFAADADLITDAQYAELIDIVGRDFYQQHHESLGIALTGETDAEVGARVAAEKRGAASAEAAA